MLVLLVASSLTVLAAAILAPSLPGISGHFNDQPSALIPLVLTMPALSVALAGGFAGRLGDRFGRKPVLIGSLALYAIAGTSGYLVDSLAALLVGRALLGLGIAGVLSMTTTLIGDYFPPEERTRFLGLQGAAMAGGGLLYLNLGGLLAEWSWRGPFLVYLCSLLLIPLCAWLLPEPKRCSPDSNPLRPLPRDTRLRVAIVYLIAATGMTLLYVVPTQLPFLLTDEVGVGSSLVALAISTTTITATLMSLVYGRVAQHLSSVRIYAIAFLLIAIGYGMTGFSTLYWSITAGIALSGLGLGLFMPNGATWLMSFVPSTARARVIGGYSSMIFLGQFLSPLVLAPLTARVASLSSAFLFAAMIAAICAVLLAVSAER